uniref:TSA: Wollemia nobilis Ref_Wollemi_Transcript_14074_2786 transcribed RNA sequence n=1 Tax=Wollemia nobilis TaxID=56998 RepID=A0A0C9S705_9CONI
MASVLSFAVFVLLVRAIPCRSDTAKPQFDEDDIKCLQSTHAGLKDPDQSLFTWRFGNSSQGFICNFVGIQCWHNDDGKVLSVKLPGMNLGGGFPSGLKYCGSMTNLDLSGNALSGEIPTDLCKWLPFLVTIDLSNNEFTGPIPHELYNCTYLNVLRLNDNKLSGQIPWELTRLERLKDFNFANNMLSGQIPSAWGVNNSQLFQNNAGLCGKPLTKYCGEAKSANTAFVIGGAAAGVLVVCLFGFAFWWWFIRLTPKKLAELKDENKWAKRIKGSKSIQLFMFERPIVKIRLADLMTATNDFNPENIIGAGRTGTVYKATLADGSVLAIKRLRPSSQTERQFKSEMNTLAHLRHRNLVPLLGYCIAGQEKLLVYKHMPNGNLWECLHNEYSLDWTTRLKVGIGAARGLAWLHHSCNPRVIHRNISSNSILLDEEYEPRITDFGLARLMNPVDTHLSTFINGDFGDLGYVAPEYMRTLVATLKGDVYSFGVVLVELVTGQKPIDVDTGEDGFKGNLVDWITQLSNNGRVKDAIDKSLVGNGHDDELLQFLRVACACVLSGPKERPSMYEVYQLLRAIGEKYNFSDQNDEIPLVSDTADADYSDELIVARET